MIAAAEFGIYDITGWNPNVALELGVALGRKERCFISFNPTVGGLDDVPSDIKGRDRIEYTSLTAYQDNVERLVAEHLPLPVETVSQLDRWRDQILSILQADTGLKIGDLAKAIGVNTDLARLLIAPLVREGRVRAEGATRAMRYFKS